MRKILTVFLLMLVALPALTMAATSTTPQAELKDKITMARAERVKNYTDRVIERLNRAMTRIADLNDRADKLITKFEGQGKDMTAARAKQAPTTVAIAAARAAIDGLPAKLAPLESDKLTKAQAKAIRDEIQKVVKSVKAAHQAVVEVIRAIKVAAGEDKGTATSTPH